jgi:hypothetical protein
MGIVLKSAANLALGGLLMKGGKEYGIRSYKKFNKNVHNFEPEDSYTNAKLDRLMRLKGINKSTDHDIGHSSALGKNSIVSAGDPFILGHEYGHTKNYRIHKGIGQGLYGLNVHPKSKYIFGALGAIDGYNSARIDRNTAKGIKTNHKWLKKNAGGILAAASIGASLLEEGTASKRSLKLLKKHVSKGRYESGKRELGGAFGTYVGHSMKNAGAYLVGKGIAGLAHKGRSIYKDHKTGKQITYSVDPSVVKKILPIAVSASTAGAVLGHVIGNKYGKRKLSKRDDLTNDQKLKLLKRYKFYGREIGSFGGVMLSAPILMSKMTHKDHLKLINSNLR